MIFVLLIKIYGCGSEFYQDFKTVAIYCGKGRNYRYVGKPDSDSRLRILQILTQVLIILIAEWLIRMVLILMFMKMVQVQN